MSRILDSARLRERGKSCRWMYPATSTEGNGLRLSAGFVSRLRAPGDALCWVASKNGVAARHKRCALAG